MGEYAEMCIDRDWGDFIYDIDHYYDDDFEGDNPYESYYSRKRESSTLYGKKKLPYNNFDINTSILLRQENSKLNRECVIVRNTDKAVLFKIDCKIEDDLKHDYLFWMPRSVMFMLEGESKVVYLKSWATIKNILK